MMGLILVVDDDALSRELVSEFLGAKGYRVLTSTSAEEALSLVKEELPVLVLMDIRLPGMDGLAATRTLKGEPLTHHIPVIATTALASNSDQARVLEAGCEAHLAKPLDLQMLLATVKEFLGPGEPTPAHTGGTESLLVDLRPSRHRVQDQATERIRVYLVEDQPLLREGLGAMLELETRLEVVGETEDAEQALRELETLDVDLVLMDIRLPGMNGVEATRLLKEQHPDLAVVVLTSYNDEYFEAAVEAGATGYITKSCEPEQLVQAVLLACQAQVVIDPSVTSSLVREVTGLRKTHLASLLTPRQLEILKLVASGSRYKEIASKLFISERTVHRETRAIFDRLGANDAGQAVSKGYKMRLI